MSEHWKIFTGFYAKKKYKSTEQKYSKNHKNYRKKLIKYQDFFSCYGLVTKGVIN